MLKQIVDLPDYVKDTKSGAILLKKREKPQDIEIKNLINRVKILEENQKIILNILKQITQKDNIND